MPTAVATLDVSGELRVLQQRWPSHEPALHQRCRFLLGEPCVALLPGSLRYQAEAGDGGSAAAAGEAAAPELVAVTAGGSVVALQPLPQHDAAQLLALQRALAVHPAAAPISGGRHAAFRGTDGSGGQQPVAVLFRHPPPACGGALGSEADDLLQQAGPDFLAPASPSAAAAQALLGSQPRRVAEHYGAEPAGGVAAAPDQQTGSSGASASMPATRLAASHAPAVPPVDAILDAQLLGEFLMLPPAAQRGLVASLATSGSLLHADDLLRAAARLNTLVASLLL